jgi:hypothetical protein
MKSSSLNNDIDRVIRTEHHDPFSDKRGVVSGIFYSSEGTNS